MLLMIHQLLQSRLQVFKPCTASELVNSYYWRVCGEAQPLNGRTWIANSIINDNSDQLGQRSRRIAGNDTLLFPSCMDANGGFFEACLK